MLNCKTYSKYDKLKKGGRTILQISTTFKISGNSAQNITQGVLVGFEQVRRFPNVYGLRRKFNLDSFPAKRRRILSLCIITTNNAASKENPETNIPGSA